MGKGDARPSGWTFRRRPAANSLTSGIATGDASGILAKPISLPTGISHQHRDMAGNLGNA